MHHVKLYMYCSMTAACKFLENSRCSFQENLCFFYAIPWLKNGDSSLLIKTVFLQKCEPSRFRLCWSIMLAAWCQRLDKLDACVVFNGQTGNWNIFVKMSLEEARSSLDYVYNHVTKDTTELGKLSMTFNRNLKNINQKGTINRRQESGRPGAVNQNDEKSVCQKALIAPWNQFRK